MTAPAKPATRAFFGPARCRAIGPFKLHELRYAAGSHASWHAHDTAAFCSLDRGGFTERIGRRQVRLTPTAVLYRAAWVEHADKVANEGAKCVVVELAPEWLKAHRAHSVDGVRELGNDGGRSAWLLRHVVREFAQPDSASQLAIEGMMLALGAELLRADTGASERRHPVWLRRTRDHLDARHMEPLNHAALAADAGVHPVYLANAFRRAFGVSMGEYVRRRRVLAARELLAASATSIAQVGLDIGFSSQSYFTRVFRRYTGTTPRRYLMDAKR